MFFYFSLHFQMPWEWVLKYCMSDTAEMGNMFDHFRGYWEQNGDPNILFLYFEESKRVCRIFVIYIIKDKGLMVRYIYLTTHRCVTRSEGVNYHCRIVNSIKSRFIRIYHASIRCTFFLKKKNSIIETQTYKRKHYVIT